ncbi:MULTISPECIES: hypothetical protein [unclassified Exiguobacterium]|uniref:hypothetical protein n=1 Tax=unclassified Exiguobacterium TaxID=2644629 RepID=UPI001BE9B1FA|nr:MULTISPECIES: hypothetical protein [unclassified Exiguobacterium]
MNRTERLKRIEQFEKRFTRLHIIVSVIMLGVSIYFLSTWSPYSILLPGVALLYTTWLEWKKMILQQSFNEATRYHRLLRIDFAVMLSSLIWFMILIGFHFNGIDILPWMSWTLLIGGPCLILIPRWIDRKQSALDEHHVTSSEWARENRKRLKLTLDDISRKGRKES